MAIADLDIVISRLGDGIVDFGDGVFYAFQGLAYFLDGQWGRASISFDLARAGQSQVSRATDVDDASRLPRSSMETLKGHEKLSRKRGASGCKAPNQRPSTQETSLRSSPWHSLAQRSSANSGSTAAPPTSETPPQGGPPGPMISFVAQSIAATWASRPDAARDWAYKLRTTPLAPWTDRAAQWLEARTEVDDTFAERVEPLARAGLPEIPILDALINLELYQRSSGAVQRAARSRVERTLLNFGGDRLLMALFPHLTSQRRCADRCGIACPGSAIRSRTGDRHPPARRVELRTDRQGALHHPINGLLPPDPHLRENRHNLTPRTRPSHTQADDVTYPEVRETLS